MSCKRLGAHSVFVGLFALILMPWVALAQATPIGLTVQPIKISHTLKEGEVTEGVIKLTNASEEKIRVESKIEDFIPLAGSETIQFVGRAEGVTTVRDWIVMGGEGVFELEKGETKMIPYKIVAPQDAEPGGHFGVLFFKATRIDDTAQLKVGTQVGVLTFVTIPGNQLQKGKILAFDVPFFVNGNSVPFTIKFENTGTVHFEPKGVISVKNILGKVVAEIPVEGQVVLPTGIKDLHARMESTKPLFGYYKVNLEIKDGEGNVLTADGRSFWAFPLWYVGIFLAGFILFFILIRLIRRYFSFSVSIRK